jgi:hypothetical protein
MSKNKYYKLGRFWVLALVFALTIGIFNFPQQISAASLTSLSDNQSRLAATTLSDHTIQFITPTGVTVLSQTVTINFNSYTTVTNITPTDVNINVSASTSCASFSSRTVAASAGADIWGVGTSSTTLTLTAPSSGTIGTSGVPAGRCMQIKVGSNAGGATRVTNPSAGTATLSIAGTFGDTGTIGVPIIANDQVSLTATVNPTISLTLSQTSLAFGTLTTANGRWATNGGGAAVATSGLSVVGATNATSGYSLYVLGPTLTSGANTIAALASSTASSPGTAQFGINVSASGGSGTVTAPYATASQYAYTSTASTQTQVASSTTADSGTTYAVSYLANISASTPAGSYTATHTWTITGNF